jgi:uncharacterized protein YbjT (DUF2867 family)
MTTVAVVGGTGWVGQHVVRSVQRLGATPVVVARSTGTDLVTGSGLEQALREVDAVIDVSNIVTRNGRRATAFFETATRNLLAAEEGAGVGHHVLLSIVGVDRVDLGYYRAKRSQEDLVRRGAVPWTILRTTQFHEFAAQLLGDGPVAFIPSMLSQPVAAKDVADELARLSLAPAAGMAPELAGPLQERVPDMVRRLARARDRRTLVLTLPVPGAAGGALRGGALLPTGDWTKGGRTFDEWLREVG